MKIPYNHRMVPPPQDGHGIEQGSNAWKRGLRSAALGARVEQGLDTRRMLPVRYSIKEDESGRFITCVDAPNIAVRLARGFTVGASAARKYAECSIFLDGAAASEPFMDVQKKLYNLDHHEGVVRAFTLATCEQAMVVVMKGLDLGGEHWTVYGNEPDLDTVLAAWILLNHLRLGGERSLARRRVMPLVRLQGVIDAHGLELKELAAFPAELEESALEEIATLREYELELKKDGKWATVDLCDYALQVLQETDRLVYSPYDFEDHRQVEELIRMPVTADRIALACRADMGIYEVEQNLKKLHGDRIGLIILEKSPGAFTLRQSDPFLPKNLNPVYDRLNQIDPSVRGSALWGGSSDIGGSPRAAGTALTAQQIAEVCRWVLRPPAVGRRLALVASALLASIVMLAGVALLLSGGLPKVPGESLISSATGFGAFSVLLAAATGAILLVFGRGRPGTWGLRRPAGTGWLLMLPLALLCAVAGGSWLPLALVREVGGVTALGWPFAIVVLVAVVGVEMLFRGVVYGFLVQDMNIAFPGGQLRLSIPNFVAAVGYSLAVLVLLVPLGWWNELGARPGQQILSVASASVFMGLVLGLGRERWGSVVVPVLLHLVAASTVWLLLPVLG